ncbi:hypothetical protein BN871_BK_00280 [Paenibacillus sp. P22]|nr:hypothetical protein BN871_BK_00280 [Paenibacillus sp. P22]
MDVLHQLNGSFDLDLAGRYALDAAADRDALLQAELIQLAEGLPRELDRFVQNIVGMNQLVLEPLGDADAEPLHELQRFRGAAWRQIEQNRRHADAVVAAVVVVVGQKAFGRLHVVGRLGDEEGAAGLLLVERAQMLVSLAPVPFRDDDAAEHQLLVQAGAQTIGFGQLDLHLLPARRGADEHRITLLVAVLVNPFLQLASAPAGDAVVDDSRKAELLLEIVPIIGGRIKRGQIGEGPVLVGALGFVLDVVQHEAVEADALQTLDLLVGDFPHLLRRMRIFGRGHAVGDDAALPAQQLVLKGGGTHEGPPCAALASLLPSLALRIPVLIFLFRIAGYRPKKPLPEAGALRYSPFLDRKPRQVCSSHRAGVDGGSQPVREVWFWRQEYVLPP